jgi:hypothetical protein
MTDIKIGFSKVSSKYFLWDKNAVIKCNCCKKFIEQQFILNTLYNKLFKSIEQYPYCHTCYGKIKRKLEGSSTLVLISDVDFTDELKPVLPQTLVSNNFQEYRGSTFGACIMSDEELASEDCKLDTSNCKVAFDSNCNKQVDFVDGKELLEQRDAELDDPFIDAKAYLKKLMDAKPVLPEPKKSILLEKKEDVEDVED